MAHGYYIEAAFEDGTIVTEDEVDASAFVDGRNVFYDIVNRLHEEHHGRMVRLSLIPNPVDGRNRYDIDWRELWAVDNPRPIHYVDVERDHNQEGAWLGPARAVARGFGYQYNAPDGSNVQSIVDVD